MSERRVASAIRSLSNAWDSQLECARVLHETLLVLVIMYSIETMLWKEERSRVKGLLGIKRIDSVPNARIRELCRVKKGLDERIDEGSSVTAVRPYGEAGNVSGANREWWNDVVKAAVERKEDEWKDVLGMRLEKKDIKKFINKKRKVKRCKYQN